MTSRPTEPPTETGPDSLLGRSLSRWAFLLVYPRAILLQVAHPAVGACVAQHSVYRTDLWQRGYRTPALLQRLVQADPAEGERLGREMRRWHRTVHGTDAHGRPYHALRPELFLWVHATYLDSILTLQGLSGSPWDADEREQLYRQWCRVGGWLGLREEQLPPDIDAFTAYFRVGLSTLERTTPVRELLGPPPPDPTAADFRPPALCCLLADLRAGAVPPPGERDRSPAAAGSDHRHATAPSTPRLPRPGPWRHPPSERPPPPATSHAAASSLTVGRQVTAHHLRGPRAPGDAVRPAL